MTMTPDLAAAVEALETWKRGYPKSLDQPPCWAVSKVLSTLRAMEGENARLREGLTKMAEGDNYIEPDSVWVEGEPYMRGWNHAMTDIAEFASALLQPKEPQEAQVQRLYEQCAVSIRAIVQQPKESK